MDDNHTSDEGPIKLSQSSMSPVNSSQSSNANIKGNHKYR